MNPINTQQDLNNVLKQSHNNPVIIFKHSTACPVSRMAHDEVVEYINMQGAASVYIMVIQDTDDLKYVIADQLDVVHESPQVIVLSQGHVSAVMNHHDITQQHIVDSVASLGQDFVL